MGCLRAVVLVGTLGVGLGAGAVAANTLAAKGVLPSPSLVTPAPVAPLALVTPIPTPALPAPDTATPQPPVAPAVAPVNPPDAASCSWGQDTLATDAQLDLQGIVDAYTREWYTTTAGWWRDAATHLATMCAGQPVDHAAVVEDESHFATAIDDHRGDTAAHPANRTWNDEWIANYQRLNAIFAAGSPA